jgi:hypothetical protein
MKKILSIAALSFLALFGCNHSKSGDKTGAASDSSAKNQDSGKQNASVVAVKNGITISYFVQTQDFADASLKILKPEAVIKKAGNTLFQYDVKNFKLTEQTPGATGCNCNNSDKGQHIHQILNGGPYMARYKDTFYTDLKEGHYVNLCFLSRSFHESVKNKNAFVLSQFNVGASKEKDANLSGPLLFYSRPKGEYKGKDTKNLLLDFYLVNTDLSADGNKVRATINGTEFILVKWAAYAINGLPMGENTIKLELVDKEGNPVAGPYNSIQRKIKLTE